MIGYCLHKLEPHLFGEKPDTASRVIQEGCEVDLLCFALRKHENHSLPTQLYKGSLIYIKGNAPLTTIEPLAGQFACMCMIGCGNLDHKSCCPALTPAPLVTRPAAGAQLWSLTCTRFSHGWIAAGPARATSRPLTWLSGSYAVRFPVGFG